MSPRIRASTAAWLLAALVGCARATDPGPADPADEAAGRRAALAPIVVDNRTDRDLVIGFRPAAAAGAEVVIGRAPRHTRIATAPVPAGEPIILFARDDDGAVLALPPRSFQIDTLWQWTVPDDARFSRPSGEP